MRRKKKAGGKVEVRRKGERRREQVGVKGVSIHPGSCSSRWSRFRTTGRLPRRLDRLVPSSFRFNLASSPRHRPLQHQKSERWTYASYASSSLANDAASGTSGVWGAAGVEYDLVAPAEAAYGWKEMSTSLPKVQRNRRTHDGLGLVGLELLKVEVLDEVCFGGSKGDKGG
jgi:hypothetical protein